MKIDAGSLPTTPKEVKKLINDINKGATVLIEGVNQQNIHAVNRILPYAATLNPRRGTSFLVQENTSMLMGLTHADFYFSELLPRGKTAIEHTIAGDFATKAQTELRACNTDWQRWNYRPETSKTGNVFRSEFEEKGSDVVIASAMMGQGRVILSTLNLADIAMETLHIKNTMLSNLGGQHLVDNPAQMQVLNGSGKELIFDDDAKEAQFDARIFSPRSLSNLLAEPDMPSMDIRVATDAKITVWLNDTQIFSQSAAGGGQEIIVPNVLLDKGWNTIRIRMQRNPSGAPIKATVRIHSADEGFMKQVLSMENEVKG